MKIFKLLTFKLEQTRNELTSNSGTEILQFAEPEHKNQPFFVLRLSIKSHCRHNRELNGQEEEDQPPQPDGALEKEIERKRGKKKTDVLLELSESAAAVEELGNFNWYHNQHYYIRGRNL